MFGWLFLALLLLVIATVLIKGDWEVRIATLVVSAGSVATGLISRLGDDAFDQPSSYLLLSESLVLAVLIFIALRSQRYWPLPVTALELATCLSLLVPLSDANLVAYAMGVAQGLWAYPQLFILLCAALTPPRRGRSKPWPD
jgi:hypothetical protein